MLKFQYLPRKQQTHIMSNKIRATDSDIYIRSLFFHLKASYANIKAKTMTSKYTAEFGNNNEMEKFVTMKL